MEDKQTYQKNMETKLSEIGAKIDKLEAKAQQAGEDVKADLDQLINSALNYATPLFELSSRP